jgi:hypothetical protein
VDNFFRLKISPCIQERILSIYVLNDENCTSSVYPISRWDAKWSSVLPYVRMVTTLHAHLWHENGFLGIRQDLLSCPKTDNVGFFSNHSDSMYLPLSRTLPVTHGQYLFRSPSPSESHEECITWIGGESHSTLCGVPQNEAES